MAKRARAANGTNGDAKAEADDIAACYAEYVSLRTDQGRVSQAIGTMLKRYEKRHVDTKGIKNSYKLAMMDPAMAAAQHAINIEYAAILGIVEFDAAGQGDFAEGLERVSRPMPSPANAARVRVARAHNDGYNSGLAGGKIEGSERFAVGTEEFVVWRSGWNDGHNDRVARHPEKETVTQATPRKRGKKAQADLEDAIAAGSG